MMRRHRLAGRRGFSLIEVMVAMTILSIVLLSLGKLATAAAVRGRTNDLVIKRMAALQLEANKFGAVPFSALSTWSTANLTVTRGNFTYTRKLTITAASANHYTIKIVVVPSTDTTRRDSVMFDRSLPPSGSPLCVGC